MMLYLVETRNLENGDVRVVPIAADNPAMAKQRIRTLLGRGLLVSIKSVRPVEYVSEENEASFYYAIERLYGEWCDYCDGNESISDFTFSEGVRYINETYDAYYAVFYRVWGGLDSYAENENGCGDVAAGPPLRAADEGCGDVAEG